MFEDIMDDVVDLTHEQWVMLYVLRITNELINKGLLKGNKFKFTEKGNRVLDEWLEKNGEPSPEEIETGFDTLFERIGDGKVRRR